jgi:hypothetical protein
MCQYEIHAAYEIAPRFNHVVCKIARQDFVGLLCLRIAPLECRLA